jgi:hypothetical protein
MQAQQVHDQGNSLSPERRRGAVIAGAYAMAIELTDKAAVMLIVGGLAGMLILMLR